MSMIDIETAQQRFNNRKPQETAIARFYLVAKVDTEATAEAEGAIQHKNVEYVEILQPGLKNQTYNGPATEAHKMRFAETYQRFKAEEDQSQVDGYALDAWGQITPAERATLKSGGFRSVEQVGAMPEAAMKQMGMRDLKNRANNFLETLAGPSAISGRLSDMENRLDALTDEAAELREANTLLTQENDTLKKAMTGADEAPTKRKGKS